MKTFLLFALIITSCGFSQGNFHTPENIKKFADHLFCEKDYLRSVFEYEKFLSGKNDINIQFKLGLAYQKLGEFRKSADIFHVHFSDTLFQQEYFNSIFRTEDYKTFRDIYNKKYSGITENNAAKKLYLCSYFFTDENIPGKEEYINHFSSEKDIITDFYIQKINPQYKSEIMAAIFSAVIPGSGKIYTEEYGDGITAFAVTAVLSYLSYTNFKADHKFRGWLFGGLAGLFYAGNIYGSAVSAQIYNAGVAISFGKKINLFLNQQNYFMPDYNFCK